jgi:flotillin
MNLFSILTPVIGVVLIVLAVIFVLKVMYKPAPPNVAMVVTGPTKSRTIIGKGAFVIPIIQRVDYMTLQNIQADFTSRDEIPTKDAINVLVDAVANVAISQDPELLKIAASKFLGYSQEQIRATITPVLEGNIREIISQTTLKELIQGDKKEFAERVVENVSPNLRDMGLDLTTFNIQNFKDRNGVIDNLGIENTVQISKDASKAKAAAEAEVAIAKADAAKAANDAEVAAKLEIAQKQNELAIRQAELKKASDVKKAEADAAYSIQQEEQRKTIEITTANANLAKQEKEIELREREVAITEKTLEAEIKKKAEADKYAVQQNADAALYEKQKFSDAELYERQRKAEAEKFEALQEAEAVKAESEAKRVAMENEAAGIKAKGEAEAAAIQAKALAEAEGILKKAEAMKEYGEAAMADMQLEVSKALIDRMPEIMAAAGQAYTNVDSIYMYGGESSKLTEDIMKNVTQISEGVSQTLGIDLKQIANAYVGSVMANKSDK